MKNMIQALLVISVAASPLLAEGESPKGGEVKVAANHAKEAFKKLGLRGVAPNAQVLTAAQIEKSKHELLKRSLNDVNELVKLCNDRKFNHVADQLSWSPPMGGIDVLESAALDKNWNGITKHMIATHNAEKGQIQHIVAFDVGNGIERYLRLIYKYNEGGLQKPTLFVEGC